jgi:hypothetical protein
MKTYILDPTIFKHKRNILKKFIKKGNTLDESHKNVFIQSIIYRENDIVERYLLCGMSPNTKVNGISAITVARIYRSYGIVKLLVLYGLDLNEKDECGKTIVEHAYDSIRNDEAMLVMTIDRAIRKRSLMLA